MKRPLSPTAVQALIWIGAALIVAVIGLSVFAVNRTPAPRTLSAPPAPSPETSERLTPAPAPSPTRRVPTPPSGPVSPASPKAGAPQPPPLMPTPGPMRPALRPVKPPPLKTELTEVEYIDLAARMLIAAEKAPPAQSQAQTEKAFEVLLRERGVDEEAFRRYSDTAAADPTQRDRIAKAVISQADRLRVRKTTARSIPPGSPPR